MERRKVGIVTLGCKVNQCDGEEIGRALAALGYEVVGGGDADCYVVNTCTVTGTADAKARKLIRRLAREHEGMPLVVTGCLAQRDPEAAASLPGVAAVVPNDRKSEVAAVVARLAPVGRREPVTAVRGRTRAFLKVQDGCDHRCAYCIVPEARGAPASRPLGEALEELRGLAESGTQEVVLCGIRLGAYGRERGKAGLARLLRELRAIAIPRVRLSSIEPMDIEADLLEEMSDHPTLCRHLHVPLQSGDDEVLAAMGRGYTRAGYAALVERVRRMWADAALTTDVMVGFPGETDEEFEGTVEFVKEIGFSRLHVFPYSERPGTAAAARPDPVPEGVRRGRAARLLEVGQELARRAAEKWVRCEVEVLFEERGPDGLLSGLTEHYVRARCEGPREWVGRIVGVRAMRARDGEVVAEAGDSLRPEPRG